MIRHSALLVLTGLSWAAPAGARAAEEVVSISIDNFTFLPASVTVAPGSRVTWTNHDDIPHTITATEDPKATRSHALDTGDSYTRVFAHAGTYQYFCSLHPHMQGVVVVR